MTDREIHELIDETLRIAGERIELEEMRINFLLDVKMHLIDGLITPQDAIVHIKKICTNDTQRRG